MSWKQMFAVKSLEMLAEEAKGENRLRRILGPIGLTSLGVGAIIGAGIFVMTGRVAANDAGPAIILSYVFAGIGCAFAAFCYAEFSSMAPVAGSAYTYAYATLGELLAWIIGWDLILEYAMSAATVASAWSQYFNKLLVELHLPAVPDYLCSDPFTTPGAWFNLPAILILAVCTTILVVGIRESAMSNTAMVLLKLGVVVFVIAVGFAFIDRANWTEIPIEARRAAEEIFIPDAAQKFAKEEGTEKWEDRAKTLSAQAMALFVTRKADKIGDAEVVRQINQKFGNVVPKTAAEIAIAEKIIAAAGNPENKKERDEENFGIMADLGFVDSLTKIDNATRSNFMPYGLSGVIFGAAMVFFAFIGFDSISTHSEEAINPQRDLPFGILASLILCTILYLCVAAVITGMVPYYLIDPKAAVAAAFSDKADEFPMLRWAAILIAIGGLAGMTSVLLITFLSQARVFLAMARDGLLPHAIFGVVHEKFRTPARSTILTGILMMGVAGFTPIEKLEKMVNIGTLFAFVVVCAAVIILRIKRPEAHRPFRCPALFIVAPLGIAVNLLFMMFLPADTWKRLIYWLAAGLLIYFCFGFHFSKLRAKMRGTK